MKLLIHLYMLLTATLVTFNNYNVQDVLFKTDYDPAEKSENWFLSSLAFALEKKLGRYVGIQVCSAGESKPIKRMSPEAIQKRKRSKHNNKMKKRFPLFAEEFSI